MKKIYEAELKNNTGIPDGYFKKLVERGRALYGHGPTGRDNSEMAQMMFAMFSIVRGHEDELTEIGKRVIMEQYGDILDGVTLDLKIVNPGDKEQVELAMETTQPPEIETEDEDITHLRKDIDKRKMLNVLIQGESQNIHDLLYMVKDEMDAIDPDLFRLDLGVIKKDILLHWNDHLDLQRAMEQTYQYANIVKVTWPKEDYSKKKEIKKPKDWKPDDDEEEEESGSEGPTITVRALMLSGLLHETVKGIYELIAAKGIEDDPEKMKRVMSQTDTLGNEKEDIQFGSFVASDLRNFVNKAIESVSGASSVKNMREFVFGYLAELPADEFVEKMKGILEDTPEALQDMKITIKLLTQQIKGETAEWHASQQSEYTPKPMPIQHTPQISKEPEILKKQKKYVEMSQGELNNLLNKALDTKDWPTATEIQKYIREELLVKPFIKL